jgi:hypothetical protein
MPPYLRNSAQSLALAIASFAPVTARAGQEKPAPAPAPAVTTTGVKVYTPADFTRFAPQTAYDMLAQVPGFTIRAADTARGLGQASENVLINGQRVTDKAGGAAAQLQKIAAGDVERIEIREAASFGIAGLTGEVARDPAISAGARRYARTMPDRAGLTGRSAIAARPEILAIRSRSRTRRAAGRWAATTIASSRPQAPWPSVAIR